MSQKPNALRIGTFVLVGLALAIGAIVILGSGRLFARRVPFIIYFSDSVNGLSLGAPVKFKGVPVGQVRQIQIAFSETSLQQFIPVLIELDENLIVTAGGQEVHLRDRGFMERQIGRGLRASLEIESVITGRLYVQLDFIRGSAPPEFHQPHPDFVEIPAVSTGLAELVKSLERADIGGIAQDLRSLVQTMNTMVADLQVRDIRERVVGALDSLEKLLRSPELSQTLASVTATSDEARRVLIQLGPGLDNLTGSFTNITSDAALALRDLRLTLEQVRGWIGPESPLLGQLSATLDDVGGAAEAVGRLANTLDRNPSALLTGRGATKAPAPSPPNPRP